MKSHIEFMELLEIAEQFAIRGEILSIDTLGDGFINDTYIIRTIGDSPDYILQRKNRNVFRDVEGMMDNIGKVTAHIRRKVIAAGGNPDREVLTVIPTRNGSLSFKDEDGEFWAISLFIPDTLAIHGVSDPGIARKGGEGIGRFQRQLADFKETLSEIIPGFHDIRHRLNQWDQSLAADRGGRKDSVTEEIEWIESRRDRMMALKEKIESGEIPSRVTHNDTKIDNILFDGEGEALCVIDLDTVMSAPVLYDFGDAIRSYANTGKEDDRDLDNVEISLDMFRGFAEGYLSQCGDALRQSEIDNLALSALYITYEQVLRFLMDYIDGDTYYKVKYPEHNLVRARAQYKLLTSMEQHYPEMQAIIRELRG